jgi:H3 lysine-79-specific histone-lysine N-methyltransferase
LLDAHFIMPIFGSAAANKLAKQNTSAAAPKIRMVAVGERPKSTTNGSEPRPAIPASASRSFNGASRGPLPRPEIRTKNRFKKDAVNTIRNSAVRRASPATPPAARLHSDDEGEDSEEEMHHTKKKRKIESGNGVQVTRQIRDPQAFQPGPPRAPEIVHMEEIATIGTARAPNDAYVPLFMALAEDEEEAPTIELQYPSSQCEKYQLVVPKAKGHANNHTGSNNDTSPFNEIREVIKQIATYYMGPAEAKELVNEDDGLVVQLRRLEKQNMYPGRQTQYIEVVKKVNESLQALHDRGVLSHHLAQMESLPLELIEHILDQIYARTVSPQVHLVRKYKAFDDSVYGELRPKFLTRIFKETKLRSDQVFVDLGHGVGNCVLQAALEIGCESYGCEKQNHPAELAELQQKEFPERCRMWGIKPGKVRLIHGDFLEIPEVDTILKRADVVLINNQAFNPPLMDALKYKFLDLKNGCQIVCLKPFRDTHFKTREDNISDPQNKIDVTEYHRYGGDVDWADAHGKWYIHRKDDKYIEEFLNRR